MRIVERARPHRRALFVLLALLAAAGVRATFTSSRSIYPRVAFARIAVIVERGENPVRGMLLEVTRPIEQAVSAVPDLQRVRSKTIRGASEFSLDFRPTVEMRDALALVRARVAGAALPADCKVTIEQQTPAVFPVMSFNVLPGRGDAKNPVARARLAEWCELNLRPRLARLPDAFMVTVQSGDRREYVFEADPVRLAATGISAKQVVDALANANVQASVGRSSAEGLQYQILVDGLVEHPSQLGDVAVARENDEPVRLADLGSIVETTAEQTTIVTGGGVDATVVSVFLRDGGKVTDLSRDVAAILADERPHVPGGGSIETVYDQATLVNDAVAGVEDAIGLGALLSILVIAVFLGDLRMTIVAGLAIPVSVALTIAMFPLMGESLNLMSLGGLAVAIGFVIDDAIVTTENVARRLQKAGSASAERLRVIGHAVTEVFGAVVGSSLTTVVVFLPLVLLEGVVGQFFRSLSLALGVSIVASAVVSLVYAPLLLATRIGMPRAPKPRRWMTWLQDRYGGFARGVLGHRTVAWIFCAAVLVAGFAGLGETETGLFPQMDEGGFVLDYTLPVGSSLAETDAACRRVEAILASVGEIRSFSRRTGAELGFFATEQFTGDFLIGLKPREERNRSIAEVMDDLRERLAVEVPQSEFEFVQAIEDTINDLAGNPEPIEVKLLGSDYKTLQAAAADVEHALESIPGVVDVASGVSFGSPELRWRPNPYETARVNLTNAAIAEETTAQLVGIVATRLQQRDIFVDVRVRVGDAWRSPRATTDAPPTVMLPAPRSGDGLGVVPISSLATFERTLNENELARENQTPMVTVTAAVSGRDLGSAAAAVEKAVLAIPRDPSVRVEFGGQAASQKDTFANMMLVCGIGAGLVFLLLVAQFRSLRLPAVMFLTLPFGQLGGLYALKLSGVALNVSSGMGLIMLVGLVVKNGIIMIESAQQLRRDGMSDIEAVIEAARVRLRPILMTTLAAIAGLVPLALKFGTGSELQRPLAIAVIGGLVVSTIFTLIVVPLGCATLARGSLNPEADDVA